MFENAPLEQGKRKKEKVESKKEKGERSEEKGEGEEIKKFVVGQDFYLAFSPEREDPNNASFNTSTIPKVVGGITPACLEIAQALYNHVIVKTVPVSSTRAAEATKMFTAQSISL
jgi:UDP-N-acetyl-D-glucosamine dehydrogenase